MRQANNMKIAVAGTGYVGLCDRSCPGQRQAIMQPVLDVDEHDFQLMKQGISPIYEPDTGAFDAEK